MMCVIIGIAEEFFPRHDDIDVCYPVLNSNFLGHHIYLTSKLIEKQLPKWWNVNSLTTCPSAVSRLLHWVIRELASGLVY